MYKVLYVDDDPHLLEIARFFLEDSGDFIVATSTLATEALSLPGFAAYDAIISDYEMPRMDGITFLKSVRTNHGDIPFILFTGKGREEVAIEAINNGADFYLQKGGDPTVQFAELAHTIKKAVERRRAEVALLESERRYHNLYQFALVGLFETSLNEGVIIACNQQYCDLAGFASVEEAIGKNVIELYANPDDRSEMSRILREQGHLDNHEVLFRNLKTGRLFWGQFSARIDYKKDIAEGTIIDITERKRLETDLGKKHEELLASYEDLTATKEKLRAQFDQLTESEHMLRINDERLVMAQRLGHTGSWEYDFSSNTIWGSAEGLSMFGYPPVAGNFPLADIEACISERERVHQALVDLIAEGKEYNIEYAVNPADGSASRMMHSTARLERDARGKPLRVIGIIQDITEYKRVEEEITFKNVILSTQQETSLDGILIVDENAKILHYNQRFSDLWGIPDALLALQNDEPVLQYVVRQVANPEPFLSRVRYLYDHREEKSFEEINLKDGRILERFSAPMLGESGKYYGRVWYFRDITGRKRDEEHLRESETRFHSLYTNMIEGAALHELTYNDRGEPEDYIIIEANPAFEKQLGISRDKVIGRTSRKAYGVAEPPYLKRYARVALTGTPEVFETNFPPLDKYFSISVYSPAKGRFATIFEDITERMKSVTKLRENEEKYRLLTENTADVIYSLDLLGKITYISPHIALYGYSPEHLLSRNIAEIICEEDLDHVLADFETTISTGKATRTLFRLKDAAGNLVWFEDNGSALKDAFGKVIGVSGIIRDITERRQAEGKLRESEQRFRQLFDTLPMGMWVADKTGTLIMGNPAGQKIWEENPHVGQEQYGVFKAWRLPSREPVRPDDWALGYAVNEGRVTEKELLEIEAFNGEHKYILNWAAPLKNETGEITGAFVLNQDITEIVTADRALLESEERYRTYIDNAPYGIFIVDKKGRYLEVNPAACSLLGYTHDEFMTLSIADIVSAENRTETLALFSDLQDTGSLATELLVNNKNGTVIPVSISAARLPDSRYIAFCTDITDRKRAEDALRKSEEKNRITLEATNDGVWDWNIPSGIVHFSPRWYTQLGYEPDELPGSYATWQSLIHPEDLGPAEQVIADHTRKKDDFFSVECRMQTKQGDWRWIVSRGKVVERDTAGHPVRMVGTNTDITERKRTEEENWKARQILEGILNSIEVRVFWKDRNLTYLGCNTPFARDAGFEKPEDIAGKDDFAMGWHDQAEIYRSDDRNVIESGMPKMFIEEPQKTPSGDTILILTSKIPLRDAEGSVIGVLGTYIDITERKRAEEALRESEERLGLALDVSHMGIWDLDLESHKAWRSLRHDQIFGYDTLLPEWTFEMFLDHILPEDRAYVNERFNDAITYRHDWVFECRIRRTDGETRWIWASGTFQHNYPGESKRMIGLVQDITERKRNEEALRESEEKYRILIENSHDAVFIYRGDRFVFINRKATELSGFDHDELMQKNIWYLIHPDDREQIREYSRQRFAGVEVSSAFSARLLTHDGRTRWVEFVVNRISIGGEPAALGMVRDITGRKMAEEALAMANKKLTLLSSVTRHDITNQLTTLQGYRTILEKKIPDPELGGYFRKIDNSAERIAAIIRFAKEYEKIGIKTPEWQDIRTQVDSAIKQAPLGTVVVKNDLPTSSEVYADPLMFRVFYNLMENAVRYGGKISTIRFFLAERDGNRIIVCEDDGYGVPAEEKERIFDRGFGKNTGLGLFLAREILSITGISIRETGEPGEGARFEIIVPVGDYRVNPDTGGGR